MSPDSLPTTVIVRTKLSCVLHCNELNMHRNILLCHQDDISSPHAKFQLETVDSDESLYNIRCCYNNKLWTSYGEGLIRTTEKKAGETTLFKIERVDSNNSFRLMSMKLQRYVCINNLYDDVWALEVNSETSRKHSHDVFTVINWDSLVILPKDVAFKADNGCYIFPERIPFYDGKYFLYASITDIGDRRVANEIITQSDQNINIKNKHCDIFWKIRPLSQYSLCREDNPVVVPWDTGLAKALEIVHARDVISKYDDDTGSHTKFFPIKTNNERDNARDNARDFVALRDVKIGKLCIRKDDKFVCSDGDATISEAAKLKIEELVVSRKVYDVDFRFNDSLLYNENVVFIFSDKTINRLPDTTTTKPLRLESKETISSTYDTGSSVRSSMAFSLEATIPLIKDGLSYTPKAEISTEEEKKYAWGKATQTDFTIIATVRANAPPETQVTAKMEATKAKCEIPFSYTQRDVTTRGEHVVQTKEDGVYTCSNFYKFKIKITQEKLP